MQVSMHMMADALERVCRRGRATEASERLSIDAVLPYEPGLPLEEGVLYVMDGPACSSAVEVRGKCGYVLVVGEVPEWLAPCACDYLVAHEGLSYAGALAAALRALRRFEQWHARLVGELLGACDLNTLCAVGTEILERPVLIYDKNYNVVGNSIPEDEGSFSAFLEKRSSYYVTRPEVLQTLMRQREFEETFHTRKAAVHYGADSPEGVHSDRSLYVNIGRGNVYQGRVVVPYDGADPRPGDFQIAEILCDAVRAALRRPSLREADLDRVFRAYFASLLEGRAGDDRLLSDSLRLWNWPRRGRFVCLWAQLSPWAVAAETDAFLCYRLEMELIGSCAVRYDDGIACVVPFDQGVSTEEVQAARSRFKELVADMAQAIGSSEEYEDVLFTGEFFIEARIAAGMCERLGVSSRRFGDIALRHYHEHGCSQLPAVHFCDPDVKRLMAFRGERKDYYAVLECYLEHNMNLLHTSEALFVHRTTLFNYLKEIRALIDVDLDDPEARLRLLASFRIMAQDEVAGVAASIAAET